MVVRIAITQSLSMQSALNKLGWSLIAQMFMVTLVNLEFTIHIHTPSSRNSRFIIGVLISNNSLKSATDNLTMLVKICLVTLESTDNARLDYNVITL